MFNEKEYKKQYRLDNKEKIKEYNKQHNRPNHEYMKQYRIDNKNRIKALRKQWYIIHKESENRKNKRWCGDNKEHIKKYIKRWIKNNTAKYKLIHQKSKSKRRHLGFIPLNKPFMGCEAHHISQNFVIYIPKKIHRWLYHSVWTWQNMEQMNKVAIEFL